MLLSRHRARATYYRYSNTRIHVLLYILRHIVSQKDIPSQFHFSRLTSVIYLIRIKMSAANPRQQNTICE